MTYSVGKQLPNRKQEAASASCSGILLLSRHQAQQFLPIYLIIFAFNAQAFSSPVFETLLNNLWQTDHPSTQSDLRTPLPNVNL
ncbi:hypothetical protein OUZ56_001850 [Daphnia magna]|uniref:Uncharacterized protein n=1 Tax=Daphnia magna TaxID=35525 RepID=A0ABR0A3Y3_9CRUS|nr:hypothetical protein OUZ56_001850 [Daphnia magna]